MLLLPEEDVDRAGEYSYGIVLFWLSRALEKKSNGIFGIAVDLHVGKVPLTLTITIGGKYKYCQKHE